MLFMDGLPSNKQSIVKLVTLQEAMGYPTKIRVQGSHLEHLVDWHAVGSIPYFKLRLRVL